MKKIVSILLLVALSMGLVFAGGGSEDELSIAYVTSDLSNEIFAMQVEAMEDYCDEIGVDFLFAQGLDTQAKISAIENYTAMGVDCIIVHVNDAEAFIPSMKAAQEKGIVFFAYDMAVEGADIFYGWENYDLGVAIGNNAADWIEANFSLDETVNVASCNYPSFDFLVVREKGYVDVLNERCPNIEWVAEGVGGYISNGVTSGENFLQIGKDVNVVVGINDAGVLGVNEAFNAAGYGGDKVGLFGCDATTDGIAAIKDGGIFRGTVTTGLVSLAPEFIDIAISVIEGGEGGDFFGPAIPINVDNVSEY